MSETEAGKYKGKGSKSGGIWSKSTGKPAGREYGDKGSASRYFKRIKYCPKASKKERNKGLEGFKEKQMNLTSNKGRTWNDRCANCGKKFISSKDTICHCDNPKTDKSVYKQCNNHPTVKPLPLLEYLVELTKMPNKDQIYLDCFIGSGSTAMAVKKLSRNYIGIEKEEDYCRIARARIKAVNKGLL